jgi:TonB family protein
MTNMSCFFLTIRVLAAAIVLSGSLAKCHPQESPSAKAPQGEVVLTKLANPAYPPLARQTRITGDVELVVEVKSDGSVQSVNAVKGHPLLKQTALDSAQRSLFECRKCGEGTVFYSMVYTFQLNGSETCCTVDEANANARKEQPLPRVVQNENHVTLIDQVTCNCDPGDGALTKVRSAKCLYLWKCGVPHVIMLE